jgi:hypothetical protein
LLGAEGSRSGGNIKADPMPSIQPGKLKCREQSLRSTNSSTSMLYTRLLLSQLDLEEFSIARNAHAPGDSAED